MNQHSESTAIVLGIILLIILFAGEPDIQDAIIHAIMECQS